MLSWTPECVWLHTFLKSYPNRFAYSKSPQLERVLDTRAMNYVTKCQEAGVGPAGILTKIDRLVTALDFVIMPLLCLFPLTLNIKH